VKGGAGIWFDRYELTKVDESRESAGQALLDLERDAGVGVDGSKRLSCPKCADVVMMRHFFSVRRQVTIDECPNCGSYWLDIGELATVRSEFESKEAREQAAARYLSKIFDHELAAAHAETAEDLERAQKIARVFRLICPSYYAPGKQEWGAF